MGGFDFVKTTGCSVIEIQKPSATNSIAAQDSQLATAQHLIACGRFTVHHPLGRVQRAVMDDMAAFYADDKRLLQLCKLINQKECISLRTLDWLVTSYARRYDFYIGPDRSVYELYKLALARFRRRNFDPFRRSRRRLGHAELTYDVTFESPEGPQRTTVGQLNFVCWTLRTGLYEYAIANKARIDEHIGRKRVRMHEQNARNVRVCQGDAVLKV